MSARLESESRAEVEVANSGAFRIASSETRLRPRPKKVMQCSKKSCLRLRTFLSWSHLKQLSAVLCSLAGVFGVVCSATATATISNGVESSVIFANSALDFFKYFFWVFALACAYRFRCGFCNQYGSESSRTRMLATLLATFPIVKILATVCIALWNCNRCACRGHSRLSVASHLDPRSSRCSASIAGRWAVHVCARSSSDPDVFGDFSDAKIA